MLIGEAVGTLINRNIDGRTFAVTAMFRRRRGEANRAILPKTKVGAMNGLAHISTFKVDRFTVYSLRAWIQTRDRSGLQFVVYESHERPSTSMGFLIKGIVTNTTSCALLESGHGAIIGG